MPPDYKWSLLGLALLSGACQNESLRPTAQELRACENQDLGDEDFDPECCDVWIDECIANGDDGCEWICNG